MKKKKFTKTIGSYLNDVIVISNNYEERLVLLVEFNKLEKVVKIYKKNTSIGLVRDLNPGPPAP